jgi:CMP-N,N'-diacetyllegionaminic acid synthase
MTRVLGIVPARGGSKRLPRKNLAEVRGKPLIHLALQQATDSGIFDRLVVSTDDPDIARCANSFSPGIAHKRPDSLARDDTPMLPVVTDALDHFPAEIAVLLQPTSPLRTSQDIRAAYNLLAETKGDSVFSVTAAEEDLVFEVGWAKRVRSVPSVVVPNGAIYIITRDALERGENWYTGLAYGYIMPKDRSLDIDTALDLEIARMVANGVGAV